jgi:hypothetical protein
MENVWRLSMPEQKCGLRGRINTRNGDERDNNGNNEFTMVLIVTHSMKIICTAYYISD